MSRWPESWSCTEIQRHAEAFLDGDLPETATTQIASHLRQCSECAAQVQLAKEIQRELQSLPVLDAPDATLESILDQTVRRSEGKVRWTSLGNWRLRPAWVALAAASLALALGWGLLQRQDHRLAAPDDAAIAQATVEARYALARAGLLTRKAGLALRDRTLRDQIAVPTRQGLTQILGSSSADRPENRVEGVDDV